MDGGLRQSRALWNRSALRLHSDETLAQILDRGEMEAWRTLYQLASTDPDLRKRMLRLVHSVPIAMPHFWQAALASLGEHVDYDVPCPPLDADWA